MTRAKACIFHLRILVAYKTRYTYISFYGLFHVACFIPFLVSFKESYGNEINIDSVPKVRNKGWVAQR